MSNTSYTTIKLNGNSKNLKSIVDTIIKYDHDVETINFDLISNQLFPLTKETVCSKLGYDYDSFLCGLYSEDILNKIHTTLENYLLKSNSIGYTEDYLNDNILDCRHTIINNELTLKIQFANSAPLNFFVYVSQKYDAKINILQKIEGGDNFIAYEHNGQYTQVAVNIHNILENRILLDCALNLKLTNPSEIVLAAIFNNNLPLAKEFIYQYSIASADIIKEVNSIMECTTYYITEDSLFNDVKNKNPEQFSNLMEELQANAQFLINNSKANLIPNSLKNQLKLN